LETELWQAGYRLVAGADEVGRGAWAGPVVAAAVILPPDPARLAPLLGSVDDSKKLTPRMRERLFATIQACALAVGVGNASAAEIDALGIAPANRLALRRAVEALALRSDFLLLDFLTLPDLPLAQRGVPHGDACSLTIAAASIIAKVTRDAWMVEQDGLYPGYGFTRHKGYGTAAHQVALDQRGPCPLHRRSFAPVAAAVAE
jgi:ribonuclease HII